MDRRICPSGSGNPFSNPLACCSSPVARNSASADGQQFSWTQMVAVNLQHPVEMFLGSGDIPNFVPVSIGMDMEPEPGQCVSRSSYVESIEQARQIGPPLLAQ